MSLRNLDSKFVINANQESRTKSQENSLVSV